jgi:hypothetical protein
LQPEGPAWEEYKELSAAQERTMSLALLNNMRDTESGPSYLGYFLPTAETADRLVEMARLDDESSSSAVWKCCGWMWLSILLGIVWGRNVGYFGGEHFIDSRLFDMESGLLRL